MNDDKIRISPDALIAMIVTEAQDRELARMPSLEEMNEDGPVKIYAQIYLQARLSEVSRQ